MSQQSPDVLLTLGKKVGRFRDAVNECTTPSGELAGNRKNIVIARDHVNMLSGLHCFAWYLIKENREAIKARM